MAITLTIENKNKFKIPSKKNIQSSIQEAMDAEKISVDVIVGLQIVKPKEIQTLNKTFRLKDESTDVLSFPIFEITPKKVSNPILLGDIVICHDVVEKNAAENNKSYNEELLHLVKHATLHLLGHHHK